MRRMCAHLGPVASRLPACAAVLLPGRPPGHVHAHSDQSNQCHAGAWARQPLCNGGSLSPERAWPFSSTTFRGLSISMPRRTSASVTATCALNHGAQVSFAVLLRQAQAACRGKVCAGAWQHALHPAGVSLPNPGMRSISTAVTCCFPAVYSHVVSYAHVWRRPDPCAEEK